MDERVILRAMDEGVCGGGLLVAGLWLTRGQETGISRGHTKPFDEAYRRSRECECDEVVLRKKISEVPYSKYG
jgi:hypothetical protein